MRWARVGVVGCLILCGAISLFDLVLRSGVVSPTRSSAQCKAHGAWEQPSQSPATNLVTPTNSDWGASRVDPEGLRYLDDVSLDRYRACKAGRRQVKDPARCNRMSFQPSSNPVVALVSSPGSGSTWLRYIIEQATGVYTGSIYCDRDLKAIYAGEKVVSGNVIVVKTHRYTTRKLPLDVQAGLAKATYDKAILLVRNPYDAVISEANRRWNVNSSVSSHVGTADDVFLKDITTWNAFVETKLRGWLSMLQTWLGQDAIPITVVQYEKIMADLQTELNRILQFLGRQVTKESLDCTIKNNTGYFKRTQHLKTDPFSDENKAVLNRVLIEARTLLERYNITFTDYGSAVSPQRTS